MLAYEKKRRSNQYIHIPRTEKIFKKMKKKKKKGLCLEKWTSMVVFENAVQTLFSKKLIFFFVVKI
jgi:hypothetical protein